MDNGIDKEKRNERLGESRTMNCGCDAEIIEYNNANDITIIFKTTKEIIKSTYRMFKLGQIKSHYRVSVYGMGIMGLEGIMDKDTKKVSKAFKSWSHMLERCYTDRIHKLRPTYIGCEVCEEWLYYTNFKKWYDNNYYKVENECMHLDKDILHKGNKTYSPDNCIFVPQFINDLFTKRQNDRGEYPIGVSLRSNSNKYSCRCNRNRGKSNYVESFNTPEEAFYRYKYIKEQYIKEVAEQYKDNIPNSLFNAMYKYEVEITD